MADYDIPVYPGTMRYNPQVKDHGIIIGCLIFHGLLMVAEDLAASCFLGAFPPVYLRAVCLVRAIDESGCWLSSFFVVWWVVAVSFLDTGPSCGRPIPRQRWYCPRTPRSNDSAGCVF